MKKNQNIKSSISKEHPINLRHYLTNVLEVEKSEIKPIHLLIIYHIPVYKIAKQQYKAPHQIDCIFARHNLIQYTFAKTLECRSGCS